MAGDRYFNTFDGKMFDGKMYIVDNDGEIINVGENPCREVVLECGGMSDFGLPETSPFRSGGWFHAIYDDIDSGLPLPITTSDDHFKEDKDLFEI